jgi:hypothetical protein
MGAVRRESRKLTLTVLTDPRERAMIEDVAGRPND